MNRYHVLFVALDELGRKAMCEATCEAESESAARQCWIDSAAGEDALLALAYVDPVTSTGIVRCRDLGPVVERTVVESPFKPDVTVTHDGERVIEIDVDWVDSYGGGDFIVGTSDETDIYVHRGPEMLSQWLITLREDVDEWTSFLRNDDAGGRPSGGLRRPRLDARDIIHKMRCLLGGKPYRPEEDH